MREKVSVAMATYNGEKYIEEQIKTILVNLNDNDEVIISDDGSTDNTLDIINGFKDSRIFVVSGPKQGVKKNFENAIRHCTGRYIFLCDQDDIWMDGKVERVLKEFSNPEVSVVVHNCTLIDQNGGKLLDSYFEFRKSGPGRLKNFIKNTYIGCCMAFDAKIKDKVLPVPTDIEMHDQWIGILAERFGKSVFIDEKLILYRRHGDNTSDVFNHYGFTKMLSNRIKLLCNLAKNRG